MERHKGNNERETKGGSEQEEREEKERTKYHTWKRKEEDQERKHIDIWVKTQLTIYRTVGKGKV